MCEHVGLVQHAATSRALLSFALKGLHRTLTVTVCWKPHPCVLFRCPLFRVHHSSVILHDPFGCRGAAWSGLKNLRHLFKTVPMGQSNPVPFLSSIIFFFINSLKCSCINYAIGACCLPIHSEYAGPSSMEMVLVHDLTQRCHCPLPIPLLLYTLREHYLVTGLTISA